MQFTSTLFFSANPPVKMLRETMISHRYSRERYLRIQKKILAKYLWFFLKGISCSMVLFVHKIFLSKKKLCLWLVVTYIKNWECTLNDSLKHILNLVDHWSKNVFYVFEKRFFKIVKYIFQQCHDFNKTFQSES